MITFALELLEAPLEIVRQHRRVRSHTHPRGTGGAHAPHKPKDYPPAGWKQGQRTAWAQEPSRSTLP
jgi:hypothetical protein